MTTHNEIFEGEVNQIRICPGGSDLILMVNCGHPKEIRAFTVIIGKYDADATVNGKDVEINELINWIRGNACVVKIVTNPLMYGKVLRVEFTLVKL